VSQDDAGRHRVEGAYVLDGQSAGFAVGAYDPTRPLVIDPVLVYSTFLGGTGQDGGSGIKVDAAGDAYITGTTLGADFPVTPGVVQPKFGGTSDVFVTKL